MKQNQNWLFKNQKYKQFKILPNGDKIPVGEKHIYTAEEAEKFITIQLLTRDNLIALDIDNNEEGAQKIIDILNFYNIKCYCTKTPHGYHFLFRKPDYIFNKGTKNNICFCGVKGVEYKFDTNGVIIKHNGTWDKPIIIASFQLEEELDIEKLDKLPFFLLPLCKKDSDELPELINLDHGDGRNDTFANHTFAIIRALYNIKGIDKKSEEFKNQWNQNIDIINDFIFATPYEENKLYNFSYEKKFVKYYDEKNENNQKKSKSDAFIDRLLNDESIFIDNFPIKEYKGQMYAYIDDTWTNNETIWKSELQEIDDRLLPVNYQNIVEKIKIKKGFEKIQNWKDNNYIPFKNCFLKLRKAEDITKDNSYLYETVDYSEDIFVNWKLDIDFDIWNIKEEDRNNVDKFLDDVFGKNSPEGDEEQVMLFLVAVGYTFMDYKQSLKKVLFMPIDFKEIGDNGKSRAMQCITDCLIDTNGNYLYSSKNLASLDDEKDKHALFALVGKKANIDEEGLTINRKCQNQLKKLATPNKKHNVEEKYKNPTNIELTIKNWCPSNGILKIQNVSQSFVKKIVCFNCSNCFTGKEDNFIDEKLGTDGAKTYFIKRAIEEYAKFLLPVEKGGYGKNWNMSKAANEAQKRYLELQKSSYEWIKDNENNETITLELIKEKKQNFKVEVKTCFTHYGYWVESFNKNKDDKNEMKKIILEKLPVKIQMEGNKSYFVYDKTKETPAPAPETPPETTKALEDIEIPAPTSESAPEVKETIKSVPVKIEEKQITEENPIDINDLYKTSDTFTTWKNNIEIDFVNKKDDKIDININTKNIVSFDEDNIIINNKDFDINNMLLLLDCNGISELLLFFQNEIKKFKQWDWKNENSAIEKYSDYFWHFYNIDKRNKQRQEWQEQQQKEDVQVVSNEELKNNEEDKDSVNPNKELEEVEKQETSNKKSKVDLSKIW